MITIDLLNNPFDMHMITFHQQYTYITSLLIQLLFYSVKNKQKYDFTLLKIFIS